MLFTAFERFVLTFALSIASAATFASEAPPRVLQEPVFGLRVSAANPRLDRLPEIERQKCFEMADNEFLTSRQWVYSTVRVSGLRYFIVGGYVERRRPSHGESRYRVDTFGGIYVINDVECKGLGAAREVFDVGPSAEVSKEVLEKLAADLVVRLGRIAGGDAALRDQLRKQKVIRNQLPPELRDAFGPFLAH